MDKKTAKRVDGIYRSIKQLPLLGGLGLLIPIIGLLLLPITLVYSRLLSTLLSDYDSGKFTIEEHDCIPDKPGNLSTEQKMQFLKHGEKRMWVPYAVGGFWIAIIAIIVIWAETSSQQSIIQ